MSLLEHLMIRVSQDASLFTTLDHGVCYTLRKHNGMRYLLHPGCVGHSREHVVGYVTLTLLHVTTCATVCTLCVCMYITSPLVNRMYTFYPSIYSRASYHLIPSGEPISRERAPAYIVSYGI